MRLAACQLPDVQNDIPRAISLIRSYTLEAERLGARIVCFPECFLQGYDKRIEHVARVAIEIDSPTCSELLRSLGSAKPVIVFGIIEKEDGKFYNSAVAIERGAVIARYRKTHLLDAERQVFSPGLDCPTFEVDDTTVAINICYDLLFAESVARAAAAGAELLVCPCSNMMPRRLAERWKSRHNEIRAAQAKAHNVWLVSSDVAGRRGDWISYGPTAVIDPRGSVVAQVPLSDTGMVVTEID